MVAGGLRRSGGPASGLRHDGPVRHCGGPSVRVVGLLVAEHGEREPVGAVADGNGSDGGSFAAAAQPAPVGGEVVVVAGEAAAELDDGRAELDRSFSAD